MLWEGGGGPFSDFEGRQPSFPLLLKIDKRVTVKMCIIVEAKWGCSPDPSAAPVIMRSQRLQGSSASALGAPLQLRGQLVLLRGGLPRRRRLLYQLLLGSLARETNIWGKGEASISSFIPVVLNPAMERLGRINFWLQPSGGKRPSKYGSRKG